MPINSLTLSRFEKLACSPVPARAGAGAGASSAIDKVKDDLHKCFEQLTRELMDSSEVVPIERARISHDNEDDFLSVCSVFSRIFNTQVPTDDLLELKKRWESIATCSKVCVRFPDGRELQVTAPPHTYLRTLIPSSIEPLNFEELFSGMHPTIVMGILGYVALLHDASAKDHLTALGLDANPVFVSLSSPKRISQFLDALAAVTSSDLTPIAKKEEVYRLYFQVLELIDKLGDKTLLASPGVVSIVANTESLELADLAAMLERFKDSKSMAYQVYLACQVEVLKRKQADPDIARKLKEVFGLERLRIPVLTFEIDDSDNTTWFIENWNKLTNAIHTDPLFPEFLLVNLLHSQRIGLVRFAELYKIEPWKELMEPLTIKYLQSVIGTGGLVDPLDFPILRYIPKEAFDWIYKEYATIAQKAFIMGAAALNPCNNFVYENQKHISAENIFFIFFGASRGDNASMIRFLANLPEIGEGLSPGCIESAFNETAKVNHHRVHQAILHHLIPVLYANSSSIILIHHFEKQFVDATNNGHLEILKSLFSAPVVRDKLLLDPEVLPTTPLLLFNMFKSICLNADRLVLKTLVDNPEWFAFVTLAQMESELAKLQTKQNILSLSANETAFLADLTVVIERRRIG